MKTVKGILIEEIENVTYEDVNSFFNDNGGETDGNSYIIPISEIPVGVNYSDWGKEIDVNIYELSNYDVDDIRKQFEGKKWTGISSTKTVYVEA